MPGTMSRTETRYDRQRSAWAAPSALLWIASAAALAVLLYQAQNAAPSAVDAVLPGPAGVVLAASRFVFERQGMMIVGGAFVATLLPFLFGARGDGAAKFYLSLASMAVLATVAVWFLVQPFAPVGLGTDAVPLGR